MKKTLLFSFIISAIFIYGCGGGKPDIVTPEDNISGNFITFNLNNNKVRFNKQTSNPADSVVAVYNISTTRSEPVYTLMIQGVSIDSTAFQMAIVGKQDITTKKYDLINASNQLLLLNQTSLVGCFYKTKISNVNRAYLNYDQTTGYVQITKFDLDNKIIEGTFNINNMIGLGESLNQILNANFTTGTFRCKLMQQ